MSNFALSAFGLGNQFFNNTGVVLNGGLIGTYNAGTSTPQATFTDSTGVTPRTNPIKLDSSGRIPDSGEIWLPAGATCKYVLMDANSIVLKTYDNVPSLSAATGVNAFKSDTLSRVSTTLATDTDLSIILANVGTYSVDGVLAFNGLTTGTQGIKLALSFTGSGHYFRVAFQGSVNASPADTSGITNGVAVSFATISVSAVADVMRITGTVSITIAGTISVQWCQNSTSVNPTNLLSGSRLNVSQIG